MKTQVLTFFSEQMEEALRATSADTLKRITDSLAKEMEEKKRQKRLQEEAEEDEEVRRRQVKKLDRLIVIILFSCLLKNG